MSIPLGKRSKSGVEYFDFAYRLCDDITRLLIRDFGIKRVSKELKSFTYAAKMEVHDRETFIDLCNKYGIDVETSYPLWVIEYYREWVLALCRDLVNNITAANTIYPQTEQEFVYRRQYQWNAISNCYQLLQTFQTAIRILPVDVNKYMPYVERIDREIKLLKDWKKSGNKVLAAIRKKAQG